MPSRPSYTSERRPRHPVRGVRDGRALTRAVALLFGLVLVAELVAWGAASRRGLDTTDEGYYLNVIAHPMSEAGTALWFGAVLHGPWLLVGQNVTALRLFGMAMTLVLGVVVSIEALNFVAWASRTTPPRGIQAVTALGVGLSSLLVYAQVPQTPSYNTVALWALCVAAIGLLRWLRVPATEPSALGSALVGVGAGLLTLAKPTSAVLLAVISAVALLVGRRASWARVLCATFFALVTIALTLVSIGLSPREAMRRTRAGVALAQMLGGHPHMVRWDDFHVSRTFALAAAVLLLGTVISSVLLSESHGRQMLAAAVLTISVGVAGAAAGRSLATSGAAGATFMLTVVWLLPGAVLIQLGLQLMWGRRRATGDVALGSRLTPYLAGLGVLAAMPTVYAFGTNTNYWTAQARAGVFWGCAGVVAVGAISRSRAQAMLPHAMSCAVFVVLTSTVTLLAPYRGEPLSSDTLEISIGEPPSHLALQPDKGDRLTSVRSAFRAAGGTASTRVLDLTGESPGYVWAMGAVPAGQGWVIGGYPGSAAAAVRLAELMGCREGTSTWVLTAIDGPRSVGLGPLAAWRMDVEHDYDVVLEFRRPFATWEGNTAREADVRLLRPKRQALTRCGSTAHP